MRNCTCAHAHVSALKLHQQCTSHLSRHRPVMKYQDVQPTCRELAIRCWLRRACSTVPRPNAQVMDNLVGSLSRYTQLLNPAAPVKAVVSFGESEKARKAVKAVFDVAKRCAAAC